MLTVYLTITFEKRCEELAVFQIIIVANCLDKQVVGRDLSDIVTLAELAEVKQNFIFTTGTVRRGFTLGCTNGSFLEAPTAAALARRRQSAFWKYIGVIALLFY